MPAEYQDFSLYDGQVTLSFNEKSHRYRVSENGSKPAHCPSVTTILNVLNKPALVQWGINIACNYVEDNLRMLVSGDTFSVQDVFKIISQARTAPDRAREEAAEIGINVHDWLRDWWKAGRDDTLGLPQEEKACRCVKAALEWFKEHDLKPVAVEEPVYSRVDKICGRPDWIGYIDGALSVLDYKSTRAIYPELSLQCTAYGQIFYEMGIDKPETRWGLRLDKNDGSFEARKYGPETFQQDWDSFKCCHTLYERFKHLRRKPKPEPKEDYLADL